MDRSWKEVLGVLVDEKNDEVEIIKHCGEEISTAVGHITSYIRANSFTNPQVPKLNPEDYQF